ncbi:MAG: hypothetical protein GXP13_00645 [Gammaproteobacteria bacterium]|nr:hypothetical protein [Gammaproteobacteria bacterium]
MTNISNNKLLEIQAAYISTIKQANLDSQKRWQHGRLGNITVNLEGKPYVGLCYHWQEIVYVGIQKSIKSTGWRATGIAINEGTFMEHHAVLVYDPARLAFNQIFNKKNNMKSYVFDPWKSGKPQVYTLKNWLLLPFSTENQARLTKIENFTLTGHKP